MLYLSREFNGVCLVFDVNHVFSIFSNDFFSFVLEPRDMTLDKLQFPQKLYLDLLNP